MNIIFIEFGHTSTKYIIDNYLPRAVYKDNRETHVIYYYKQLSVYKLRSLCHLSNAV